MSLLITQTNTSILLLAHPAMMHGFAYSSALHQDPFIRRWHRNVTCRYLFLWYCTVTRVGIVRFMTLYVVGMVDEMVLYTLGISLILLVWIVYEGQ